ncbi:RRM domain protein [Trachipleistophora hominis]|uniref:RRM domain protein n=1 Tax=Trachipleistophora hominis TaxID=72359 RepID=L7JYR3_TRAHO|nr:RRM domain protein [Trachipleistophora hominis]
MQRKGRSRCYGFIELVSGDEFVEIIEKFNGKRVNGKPLRIRKGRNSPMKIS